MGNLKPFLFNIDFDEEQRVEQEEALRRELEVQKQEEEPEPTFSQEELDAAYTQGFDEGRAEGIRETTEATERMVGEALNLIGQRVAELFQVQDEVNAEALTDAVSVATTIARKAFPGLEEQGALTEVAHVIEQSMNRIREEPKVVIRINEDIRDLLSEKIDAMTASAGYEGKVMLVADPDIPVGDCRLEWRDGGAERDTAALWQEIDEIVERAFGGPGGNPGGAPDPSMTDAPLTELDGGPV